jgi:hypothetical protein
MRYPKSQSQKVYFLRHAHKELGVKFGRSKRLSPQQVIELQVQRQQGVLIKILMKNFDLSKASVYRYLAKISSEVP